MTTYLHGVETEEKETTSLTISDANTSAVCVIGTKPVYLIDDKNTVNKVTNFTESAKLLGNNLDGFTLADAAETILTESGGAEIYTINIFDTDKHSAHLNTSITFSNGEAVLEQNYAFNVVLKQGETPLVENTDYTIDGSKITILEGGALETSQDDVTASYDYPDFTKITDSDVIGTTDKDGNKSGIQAIWDVVSEYGIIPGIIIAPGFTSKNVRTALETIAEELKSYAYIDTDACGDVSTMEKARLKAQSDGLDLTSKSEYSTLLDTPVYRYNSYQDTTTIKPLSPVAAGLRVKLDNTRSTAKSIDNTVSKTITGRKFNRSFLLNNPNTDSNRINKLGMTTVINYNGAYYLWGGRNSSFSAGSNEGLKTFEMARRTTNFIEKSIENSSFQCVGETITRGFIDDVLNAINSKFASWSNPTDWKKQVLLGGEARYDETLNSAETLASGHIYFPYEYCMPPTGERITYQAVLDISIITTALAG